MKNFEPETNEAMDELIHEIFSEKASRINNAGAAAQVQFLLEEGWSQERIQAVVDLQQGVLAKLKELKDD